MEDPSVIVVLVMLSLFSVVGVVGNSLVMYIYSKKKEKSTSGIFIMTLAGTDFFTCILVVPFTEAVVYLSYYLKYDIACKVYMFLITCIVPFSAFIMVAIAVDRYFCICHPFLHAITLKRAKIIVFCLLVFASVLGLITALMNGVSRYVPIQTGSDVMTGNDGVLVNLTYHLCVTGNTTINGSCSDLLQWNTSQTAEQVPATSQPEFVLRYDGHCYMNFLIIGQEFGKLYPKLYSGFYLLSFIAVLILYGLIYRSIHEHRAKKSKRKRSSLYPTSLEFSMVETQMTAVTHVNPHANGKNGRKTSEGSGGKGSSETEPMQKKRKASKAMSIKERTFCANIRTAAMLFVVTVVFLIAFLPAWLMAHRIISYNQVVFYMYFVYNTANPFIYAFMNKSFRDDLRKVVKCLRNHR